MGTRSIHCVLKSRVVTGEGRKRFSTMERGDKRCDYALAAVEKGQQCSSGGMINVACGGGLAGEQ
jgi:hypothetical protein